MRNVALIFMLMSVHVRFQPSVCLPGASGRPTLIIGNLFLLVDCTEESFPSHSNLRVAQSWLVNFPLHYRSSNRLISLGRIAAIIVFYLSLPIYMCSLAECKRDRGRKDENAAAFHFHSPSIYDLTHEMQK